MDFQLGCCVEGNLKSLKFGLQLFLTRVPQVPNCLLEGSDMSQPTIGANIIRDLDLPPSVRRSDLTRRNSDVANPVESK